MSAVPARSSRETRRRDKDSEIDLPPARATGREVERAVSDARGAGLVAATPSTPVVWVPPDADAIGVSRRQFLNRATISLTGAGLTTFAAAGFVAFLWPTAQGGFGGKINVGKLDDVLSSISSGGGFFYNATARSWITQYPVDALPKAKGVPSYKPLISGMQNGIVVLYQKCPHLGCRVPQCVSSQWFECPCHGSQYNRVGEKKGGPAPRGMDRFFVHGVRHRRCGHRHWHRVSWPADRYQHHRSRGRRATLHRWRRWPRMIALATTAIGWIILVFSLLGWVIYYFANRKAARPELGSEIELAPNRRPYYDDETLEGPRLHASQPARGSAVGDHGHRSAAVLGARA